MKEIQFDAKNHIYTVDGVVLPSVTQIIRAVRGDSFDGVPPAVLKEKAEYGNKIHAWIEQYAIRGVRKRQSAMMKLTTDQVKRLFDDENIIAMSIEVPVATEHYAGTYDMYAKWRGVPTLIDIKTTYEFDEDYLAWQLGMYKLAMDKPVEKCACLWCPQGKMVHLIEVTPRTEQEIDWMVFRYETEHCSD